MEISSEVKYRVSDGLFQPRPNWFLVRFRDWLCVNVRVYLAGAIPFPALRPLSWGASWGKLTSCRGQLCEASSSCSCFLVPLCQLHHVSTSSDPSGPTAQTAPSALMIWIKRFCLQIKQHGPTPATPKPTPVNQKSRKAVSGNNRVSHARNDSPRPCDSMPFYGNCRKMPGTLHFALLCTATAQNLNWAENKHLGLAKSNRAGPV